MSSPKQTGAASGRPSGDPQLLPVRTAAERLGISKWTIHRRIKGGHWPGARLGRRYMLPGAFVDGLVVTIKAGGDTDAFAADWFVRARAVAAGEVAV